MITTHLCPPHQPPLPAESRSDSPTRCSAFGRSTTAAGLSRVDTPLQFGPAPSFASRGTLVRVRPRLRETTRLCGRRVALWVGRSEEARQARRKWGRGRGRKGRIKVGGTWWRCSWRSGLISCERLRAVNVQAGRREGELRRRLAFASSFRFLSSLSLIAMADSTPTDESTQYLIFLNTRPVVELVGSRKESLSIQVRSFLLSTSSTLADPHTTQDPRLAHLADRLDGAVCVIDPCIEAGDKNDL